MNTTAAADFMTDNKGEAIIVSLTDGTEVTGTAISVNSKGVNVKVDGKVRSFGLNRVSDLWTVTDREAEDELDGDEISDLIDAGEIEDMDEDEADDEGHTDEEIYAMLEDGMTTADLAAALSDALNMHLSPKELRVHLRALGLGVGKGRKYSLSATEFRMVRDLVRTNA